MMTIEELLATEHRLWTRTPIEACSPFDKLLWQTASELATQLECNLEVDDFIDIVPEAIQALRSVNAYLENRGVPRPMSLALVLLRLDRFEAGLPERG